MGFTIKSRSGPHKQSASLPVTLFIRNRLKYALSAKEVQTILKQRLVGIDGKTRTDPKFPTGFMDVIQIEKTGEYFRIIYDVKGRFTVHRITAKEAMYKPCKVRETKTGPNGVPYLYTSDGRTIRYPDPIIKVHDSIQVDIATGKILDTIKFDSGNLCMITGGRNTGRVGTIIPVRDIPVVLTLSTSRIPKDTPSLLELVMSSSLARAARPTFLFQRVRVSSSPSPRRETRDLESRETKHCHCHFNCCGYETSINKTR